MLSFSECLMFNHGTQAYLNYGGCTLLAKVANDDSVHDIRVRVRPRPVDTALPLQVLLVLAIIGMVLIHLTMLLQRSDA